MRSGVCAGFSPVLLRFSTDRGGVWRPVGPMRASARDPAYCGGMEHAWTHHFDRRSDERAEPGLLDRLLGDPATRVLEWSPQGCPVVEHRDGPQLWLREPRPADAGRLALFLGRDAGDTAWVAVVMPDADPSAEPAEHPNAEDELDADERPADQLDAAESDADETHADETDAGEHDADQREADERDVDERDVDEHDVDQRDADEQAVTPGTPQIMGLRDVGALLPSDQVEAFMTTQALALWHASHTHCPRCGTPTAPAMAGWTRRCPNDGSEHYPRTDAAVIMAVTDTRDRLLMARSPAWPAGRRSVLAGFVEPGERLEAAVAREVLEEVGLPVRDVTYVGSQPWPLPASLMLGFTAVTDTEELSLTDGEIAEAEWYSRDDLRAAVADGSLGLPGPLSIARRLVEGWYGEPLTPPVELPFHRPDAATSS